jgi:hypothetical protein
MLLLDQLFLFYLSQGVEHFSIFTLFVGIFKFFAFVVALCSLHPHTVRLPPYSLVLRTFIGDDA